MTEYEELMEAKRTILQTLVWNVLNSDGIDKWIEIRDSTSPDLIGVIDMFDSLIDGALDKDLSIIAERCWLKDEEENRDGALTDYLRYLNGEGLIDGGRWRKQFYTNPYKLGKELYQWLQRGSWRPVKEIKKEVTDDIKNTL